MNKSIISDKQGGSFLQHTCCFKRSIFMFQMLRAKLAERLEQRENSMLEKQEGEMKDMIRQAANKSSAKIRRMLLMHKQMVEMEKFKLVALNFEYLLD